MKPILHKVLFICTCLRLKAGQWSHEFQESLDIQTANVTVSPYYIYSEALFTASIGRCTFYYNPSFELWHVFYYVCIVELVVILNPFHGQWSSKNSVTAFVRFYTSLCLCQKDVRQFMDFIFKDFMLP